MNAPLSSRTAALIVSLPTGVIGCDLPQVSNAACTPAEIDDQGYCVKQTTHSATGDECGGLTNTVTSPDFGFDIQANGYSMEVVSGESALVSVEGPMLHSSGTKMEAIIRASSESCCSNFPVAVSYNVTIKWKAKVCASCPGPCTLGGGGGLIGSVDFYTFLGNVRGDGGREFGHSAGKLYIEGEEPSLALATPEGLLYQVHSDVEVILESDYPRQFRVPEGLADVVILDDYSYEIRFYHDADVGSKVEGLYTVTGDEFVTWKIENPDASPSTYNRLLITETRGAASREFEYIWTENELKWELVTGNGLRRESRADTWDGAHTNLTETIIVKNSSSQEVSKKVITSQQYPWGLVKVSEVVDPAGAALTTTYTYYTDSGDAHNYGRLKLVVYPEGKWEKYVYTNDANVAKIVYQFLDSATDSAENLNRVVEYSYAPVDGADDGTINPNAPRRTIDKILDQEVARSYLVVTTNEQREYRCQTPSAAVGAGDNIVTITRRYTTGAFSNQVERITHENGTISLYQYSTNATTKTTTVFTGESGNGSGTNVVDGTKSIAVVDAGGNMVSNLVYDIASGLLIHSAVTTETDDFGRPERIDYLGGLYETFSYDCCGLSSKRNKDGITTAYALDDLKRVTQQIRAGITNDFTLDPENRTLATYRNGLKVEGVGYDKAGRMTASTNALTHVTSYGYSVNATTQTLPIGDGVETRYKDGRIKSIAGSAVHGVRYEYGVETNSFFTKEIKLDSEGEDTSEWIKTYIDMLGRTTRSVYADGATAQSFYSDNKNRLTKQVDPDGVTILYCYNGRGEQEITAIDMDQDGNVDYDGTDRITKTVGEVASGHGTTIRRTTTSVWATDSSDSPTIIRVSETSADGLQSWNTSYGLETHSVTAFGGSGTRTNTVTAPDGSYTVSTFNNGRLTSLTRKDALGVQLSARSYSYDLYGRQATITDARTGTTTHGYDNGDRLTSTQTPAPGIGGGSAQTTDFGYDAMNRQISISLPDGGSVTNQYFDTGELKKTWGTRTYPVEYTYDYAGRMKTMKTWTNFVAGSGIATTTWNYTTTRGFLESKRYNDNKGPDYTYTAAGRLDVRTWERGVSTDYGYNNAGELTSINYSDSTPDVTYTYDRLGRRKTAVSSVDSCSYFYNLAGQLTNESHTAGVISGIGVISGYDNLFRRTSLNVTQTGTNLTSTSYSYDDASRLETVSDGTNSAEYVYLANSSLITNIVFKHSGSNVMVTSKVYDNLNRLQSISTMLSATSVVVSSHSYLYNSANQRTKATLQDGSYWEYAYDSLGQVTNAVKKWSDNVLVAGQQFRYAYDDIGNRTTVAAGGDSGGSGLRSSTYTANSLNQYTQRTDPGGFDVLGTAASNATVTVNNLSTYRKGEYFWKELSVTNTSTAVYTNVSIVGVKNNVGTNQEDAVTTVVGDEFISKTPEIYTYDHDGNLTSDGRWTYTWDAENRLTKVESLTNAPTPSKRKVEWIYDHQGRKVRQMTYDGSTGSYVVSSDLKIVSDGWQNLADLIATNNVVLRSYVWGLDLSGSVAGAGGVGGLVVMNSTINSAQLGVIDGNGNVVSLVSADNGQSTAFYEFSPFGETLRSSGLMAWENPFRFSTKRTHDATEMLLFEYRMYRPELGRWPSRDPMAEYGGKNLYSFVNNNPISSYDPLGNITCIIEAELTDIPETQMPIIPGIGRARAYLDSTVSWNTRGESCDSAGATWKFTEFNYVCKGTIRYASGTSTQTLQDPSVNSTRTLQDHEWDHLDIWGNYLLQMSDSITPKLHKCTCKDCYLAHKSYHQKLSDYYQAQAKWRNRKLDCDDYGGYCNELQQLYSTMVNLYNEALLSFNATVEACNTSGQ